MNDSLVGEACSLESLVGRLADEFLRRQEAGERPDVEEYVARCPQAADLLRKVLASLQLLQASLSGGLPAGDSGAEPTGTLGDFRILREVGRGGMGIVYEAEQISLGRRVALKVLPFAATMDPRQLQRFHNEARAAASLHHANIVPVYAVGCERAVHFYAMQFIEGKSLADLIAARESPPASGAGRPPAPQRGADGPPTATSPTEPAVIATTPVNPHDPAHYRRIAGWGIQAAEALEHAHSLGIIHRDVKPANLIVDGAGNLWVTDFGLARTTSDAGLTMTGDLLGTLRYMSPEQALAKHGLVDHRTDVYSLGATLYELLTGRPVFSGRDRQELLRQIAFEEPKAARQLNKAIPGELEIIVLKSLEKNPVDRYATASEMAGDLRRFLADQPIGARRPSLAQRGRKWLRRHPGVKWAAAGAMLLIAGGATLGTLLVYREQQRTQAAYRDLTDEQRRTQEANQKLLTSRRRIDDALRTFSHWAEHEGPLASPSLDANSRPLAELLAAQYEGIAALDGEDEETRGIVAGAHAKLGLIRSRLGQPEEAERALRRGLELYQPLLAANPKELQFRKGQFGCWNNLGNLLRDRDRLDEAEEAFRTALAIQRELVSDYPEDASFQGSLAQVLRNLGLTLRDLGKRERSRSGEGSGVVRRYEEAVRSFDEAVRIVEAALKTAAHEKNLQTMPRVLHSNLADTLILVGDHARAAREAEQLISLAKSPPDYLYAANIWFGCTSLAEKDVRLSAAERQALAENYFRRAKRAGQSAIEMSGNRPEVRHSLAEAMLSVAARPGVLAEVRTTTEQLVSQFPQVGVIWNTLGVADYRTGKFGEAVNALEKSVQLRDGGDGTDFFYLAMAYWRCRDEDKARQWYQRGVEWVGTDWRRVDGCSSLRAEAAALLGIRDRPKEEEVRSPQAAK